MSKRKVSTPPWDEAAANKKAIALAVRQATKELENGTASSQIVTHYLKEASKRTELELKELELKILLTQEKIESEKTQRSLEEKFSEVLSALKTYTVQDHE